MIYSPREVKNIYKKRARNYDLATWFYNLVGFRVNNYRKSLVDSLNLSQGDLVVELGCGTGMNFLLIQDKIRPSGRIIGVDFSQEMLNEASKKVEINNWKNVDLVQSDIGEYEFPFGLDGVLTSYAITLAPEYDSVIRKGAKSLNKGKRFSILDFRILEKWPLWLTKAVAEIFVRPYAGTLDMAQTRDPRASLKKYLNEIIYKEFYFGGLYLSVGEKMEVKKND